MCPIHLESILWFRSTLKLRKHTGAKKIAVAATVLILLATSAPATTLRVVSYNLDCADQGNDNNITASYAGLPTALQAIGQHHIGANAQPIDVLGVEELNSTTLTNL